MVENNSLFLGQLPNSRECRTQVEAQPWRRDHKIASLNRHCLRLRQIRLTLCLAANPNSGRCRALIGRPIFPTEPTTNQGVVGSNPAGCAIISERTERYALFPFAISGMWYAAHAKAIVSPASASRSRLVIQRVGGEIQPCSNLLTCASGDGALDTNRTCDPPLRRGMLYPLSYEGGYGGCRMHGTRGFYA